MSEQHVMAERPAVVFGLPRGFWLLLALLAGAGFWGCASEGGTSEVVVDDPSLKIAYATVTMTTDFPASGAFRPQRRRIAASPEGVFVSFEDESLTPPRRLEGRADRAAWNELWASLTAIDPFGAEPDIIVTGRETVDAAGPYHLIELVQGDRSHSFSAQLVRKTFALFSSNEVEAGMLHANAIADFVHRYAKTPMSETPAPAL